MVVYEIENRGKRAFVIGTEEHISGGEVKNDTSGNPRNVYIHPGVIVKVTEACGKKLTEGWKDEVKIVRKINRKE